MIEQEIKETLISLLEGISASNAESITTSLARLDVIRKSARELDPQLNHYLKNRSYEKALAHVQGESEIPKGRCGGRKEF